MKMTKLKRLPTVAAIVLFLAAAACAFPLRGDQNQTNSSADRDSDRLAAKLAECRSITYEQKEALAECRKAWAEKRRQFLGQKASSASPGDGPPQEGSSLFVPPKDQSRLSPGYPLIQQSGKE